MYNNKGIAKTERGGVWKMEESNLTMADLMEEIDKSMSRIYRGDIVNAKVVLVQDEGIVLNIGYHTDALLPWNEYSYDECLKDDVIIGSEFEVKILKVDDGEGNVLVSKRRAEAETALEDVKEIYEKKQIIGVKIKEDVKGGAIAILKGLRAFIPASHISHTYVEDIKAYVGKEIEVEIIEFDPKTKKIVLSAKRLAKEKFEKERKENYEKQQALKASRLEELVEGNKYKGIVTKLMPYGAFVNIGGIEGLIHNIDLSWVKIKHPKDVVEEGQEIEVTVMDIDKEKGKVALRLKDIALDPWLLDITQFEVGQVINGKVTRLVDFGAFISLSDNVEGLVHISQISDKRISKPNEVLELGQEVKVKILDIDKQNKKVSLSIKAVEEDLNKEDVEKYISSSQETTTLGDVLGNLF